jgi:hypothetical protein
MRYFSFRFALFVSVLMLLSPITADRADAACYGTNSYYNCNDSSGNSYSVQKYGNTTTVTGNNARTGSSWSQTTNRYGGNSYTTGRASNGNSWSTTTTPYGSYGTDSRGRSWSRTR